MGAKEVLISPPKDLEFSTPERKRRASIAARKLYDGLADLKNGWRLLAEACAEIIEEHLYVELGYKDYMSFFAKHDIDPFNAIHYAKIHRKFANTPLINLPYRRLIRLLSLPDKAIEEITASGADQFCNLSRKDFDKKVDAIKERVKGEDKTAKEDLYAQTKRKIKEERRQHKQWAKCVAEDEAHETERATRSLMFANAASALAEIASQPGPALRKQTLIEQETIDTVKSIWNETFDERQHIDAAAWHMSQFVRLVENTVKDSAIDRDWASYFSRFNQLIESCRAAILRYDKLRVRFTAPAEEHGNNVVPIQRAARGGAI